jgi:hypothetical protein
VEQKKKKTTASPLVNSSKSITKNVNLVKKNPQTWQIILGPSGRYDYKLVGTKLSGVFNGHGLVADTAYTLASYKSGNNIVVLGTAMVNARGDLHIINDPVDVGVAQEWAGDYIGQPAGYKIWLVPTGNVAGQILTWKPYEFLFETSLAR